MVELTEEQIKEQLCILVTQFGGDLRAFLIDRASGRLAAFLAGELGGLAEAVVGEALGASSEALEALSRLSEILSLPDIFESLDLSALKQLTQALAIPICAFEGSHLRVEDLFEVGS